MKIINKEDAIKLILSIVACQGAGLLGSIFTNMSVSTWYPTMVKIRPVSRNAAVLLLPYIFWVSFAAYLNYSLLMLNP
jgi:tryptophan-rich sensory protein